MSEQETSVSAETTNEAGADGGENGQATPAASDVNQSSQDAGTKNLLTDAKVSEDEGSEGKTDEELHSMLTMLIGECAAVFELLPIVQDADIMRNIIYSGVWTRYNAEMARRHGKEGGEPVES